MIAQRIEIPRRGRVLQGLADSPLLRVVGRRLLQAVPVLIGVSFLTFALLNVLPGSPAVAILGEGAKPEQIAALNARLGLDRPFIVQYADWAGHALTGNFGASLVSGQSVSSILAERLPVSLEVIVLAFIFSLASAVPMAILAARRPRGIVDRINTVVSMIGLALPGFVSGLILVLVIAVRLRWLPAIGYAPLSQGLWANLRTVLLPSLTIGFTLFCHYTRVLRSDLVEQMSSEEYVITARAKGASPWRILIRHALRNSVHGTLTLVGLSLGTMIANTILVEQIFSLPGVGQALLQAIMTRDLYVVEGIVCLAAVTVVVANVITDVLYAVLDPRIRHGRADV